MVSMPSQPTTREVSVSAARLRGPNRLEFDVVFGPDDAVTLWFEADVPLKPSSAPALPAALPIAMRVGSSLVLQGDFDGVALANAQRAQELLEHWFSDLSRVDISATTGSPAVPSAGVGCFFSGGVDSFYSVLAHADVITHLIFVHGFDIPLADVDLADRALHEVRAAAAALGMKLVVVRTNVRELSDPYVAWGDQYHGAALAAVGHLLADHFREVLIPASHHVTELFPWGTHPDLDPLWSSSELEFLHDGEDRTRPEKVSSIAVSQVALDHLRICWENRGGLYNCGECEKCVRTMISLRAAGALDHCRTLPQVIDASSLRRLRSGNRVAMFARENLLALETSGTSDRELERALRSFVRRAPLWELLNQVKSLLRRL
ncbi:hypothetical protein [Demequina phytophila]|uniref:hypothetical protein n=1 Tax=Demequina phytophila TaxID=1638981 RepID=UPI000A6F9B37|nr:hypothetical protein [Demequina phytophila]